MKVSAPALAVVAAAMLVGTPASAQAIVDEYCTRISENDKSASDGFPLTDAGSILRQDRANYHKFGVRDAGDEGDGTFGSAAARARIPSMLDNGDTDGAVLRRIVSGTPRICVEIYPRRIFVYLN